MSSFAEEKHVLLTVRAVIITKLFSFCHLMVSLDSLATNVTRQITILNYFAIVD